MAKHDERAVAAPFAVLAAGYDYVEACCREPSHDALFVARRPCRTAA
jgi:hypothetical protein